MLKQINPRRLSTYDDKVVSRRARNMAMMYGVPLTASDTVEMEGKVIELNRGIGLPEGPLPGVAHFDLDWFEPVKGQGRLPHAALVWVHPDGTRERVTEPMRMRDAIPAVEAYAARVLAARAVNVL